MSPCDYDAPGGCPLGQIPAFRLSIENLTNWGHNGVPAPYLESPPPFRLRQKTATGQNAGIVMKIRGGSGRESDRGHFSGTFFRPLLWRRVRRRRVAGGVALHLFFLQSLGPRTPLLDQRGETGCYSSADCNLHQNTSVLSIIPSTCMMFAAITSSTPCS